MKTLIIVAAIVVVSVVFAIVMPIMVIASDADDRAGIVHGRGPAPTIPPPRPSTTTPWVYPGRTPSSSTTSTARSAPLKHLWVSSTAYCETGVMANGQPAHDGAVSSRFLPRGTSWRVLTGVFAGRVFTVEDTGSLAQFDIAMPGRCAAARAYGRQVVEIERVA